MPTAETYERQVALLAGAGILVHLLLRLLHAPAQVIPLFIVLAVGGLPLLWNLGKHVIRLEFGSDLLAGLSIVAAAFTGQYLVGAIIVLMLAGGGALESYASGRAHSVLAALHKRMPKIAHRKDESGYNNIPLDDVRIGDTLVLLPHEIVPVDGNVVEGHGRMDESYLTGEPFEISKAPGATVLSGAINKDQVLVIEATKLPAQSRHAQILQLLERTESNRPRLRRLGDRLAAWYTPLAVAAALGAWLITGDSLRFLAVIVIATPCPLLIAIPVAVLGAISLAAKRGIIVKNPAALEQIDNCRTLIFDKTGTLTYGKPVLTEVLCFNGFSRDEVLSKAASLEQYSKHPLAASVIDAAQAAGLAMEEATGVSEKPGAGLQGRVGAVDVRITGRLQVSDAALPEETAGLECVVLFDGKLAAVLRFRDTPRRESRPFISHLKRRHRARRVVLLSGDREQEVEYLAGELGIHEVYSGKTPEEKVEIINTAVQQDKTLFVGDGINDAAAMQMATVGVALGTNSDITSEAADAVVLDSSLEKTDELIHIGRRMRRIALQSAVGGMVLSLGGMALAAAGWLTPIAGAIAQELIDLVAVLNASRVGFYGRRSAPISDIGLQEIS